MLKDRLEAFECSLVFKKLWVQNPNHFGGKELRSDDNFRGDESKRNWVSARGCLAGVKQGQTIGQ